jgi:hypothetical protein
MRKLVRPRKQDLAVTACVGTSQDPHDLVEGLADLAEDHRQVMITVQTWRPS